MARILIADDDADIRQSLQRLLEMMGHQVETAQDGMVAGRKLDGDCFDGMVTDIVMPNQEGLETIREARKKFPDMWLIAMTGADRTRLESYLHLATHFGAQAVFAKPFPPKEFLAKVAEIEEQDSQPAA